MDELARLPFSELAAAVERRAVSAVEITEATLARIERLEALVNAFVHVASEEALACAARLDRELADGVYRGPLHGIPVSLKDNIEAAGLPTTAGSEILRDAVSARTATAARRLTDAGAVLMGKASVYEFAYGAPHPGFGETRNPWDPGRTSGGSSSGSAAGIAAGLCLGSLGTDTGGSVRIPSSFCGTVGLRPTYGRVSRHGLIPLSYSLDTIGPMGGSVRAIAAILQAIAGHDPADPTSTREPVPDYTRALTGGLGEFRVGVPRPQSGEVIAPAMATAVTDAVATLADLGARVVPVDVPDYEIARKVLWVTTWAEASDVHHDWVRQRAEDYHPEIRRLVELGEFLPAPTYVRAQRVRRRLQEQIASVLATVDVLVLPALPLAAYPLGDRTTIVEGREEHILEMITRYTCLASVTGLPALVLPCGFDQDGMPLGLQIVGRAYDEESVLKIGRAYERAAGFPDARPPLSDIGAKKEPTQS
jgi:aspartyl-tRNA(Asn)/glutamyl-tRNA(Gln) amidotransferase subunit A